MLDGQGGVSVAVLPCCVVEVTGTELVYPVCAFGAHHQQMCTMHMTYMPRRLRRYVGTLRKPAHLKQQLLLRAYVVA